MANKQILLFFSLDCKYCEESEKISKKIAEEFNVPLVFYPAQALATYGAHSVDLPITCVVDKKGKNPACFVGYRPSEYENELRRLLEEH